MIISHKYQFAIAVPVGLNAGDWLTRIMEEGDPGYLEVVGHANDVVVPEGCESYARFFVDSPRHRLPQLWEGRKNTPWEGPAQVQGDLEEWLKWYVWSMRKKFHQIAIENGPNGWGLRAEHGQWAYFDAPSILLRTFSGIGMSPKGEDASWGRSDVRILYMEEPSRGWRDVVKKVFGESDEARNTRDLLTWHIPVTQQFYELPDELVATYLRDSAWSNRPK